MNRFLKMMKILSLIVLILSGLYANKAVAQIATKWYFGLDMGLDFSTNTVFSTVNPTLMYDNTTSSGLQGYNVESSSVVYDNTGNLVFIAIPTATGSYGVMDKNFVSKGNIATTSDAAQGSLAFPVPGSTNTWYLCSVDAMTSTCGTGDNGTNRGANYYLVTNTGSTVTVGAANNVVAGNVAECQVGVVNSTANGYWWIIHVLGTDEFRVYSVTNSGITYHHSDHVGNAFAACDYVSMMAVNNCNNKLALAVGGNVSIFDFNNATGAISNPQTWAVSCSYGLEFSTNNQYLFVSTGTSGLCSTDHVYQYDISSGVAGTISASQSDLGATYSGTTGKSGHLQLGPDGNIYVAQMSANGASSYPHYLGRITNINTKPATFTSNYITINDGTNNKMAMTMGLPTILKASITGQAVVQIPNASSICVNNSNVFSYNFSGVAVSQTWTLTPSTGFTYTSGSSTSASPTIKFTSTGTYNVQLSVTDNCGYTYTDATSITVNPQINTTGTITCSPLTGNVTSPGAYTYVWYADAALTQPIATGSTNVALPNAGSGTYYVAAQSSTSSSNTTNTLLTTATYDGSYSHAGGSNSIPFTVNKKIVVNSFQWAAGGPINYGTPGATLPYTVSIMNAAGTLTYWTSSANAAVYNSLPMQTSSPAVTLPPGSYKIVISGASNPNTLSCSCSPTVAGDNAVTITGGTNLIQNFNYTATTYTVTTVPCSNAGSITFNCPLPVTFVDMTAQRIGNGTDIAVAWSTATEDNSSVFFIQRSLDGKNYETVGQLNASYKSTALKTYSFMDVNAPLVNIYYRIVEEDVDGKMTISRAVYVGAINILNTSLVPNPGQGSFTIEGLAVDVKLQVMVYSVTGQLVYSTSTYPGETVELDQVAKGFYLVKIIAGSTEQTIRYINQ